MEREEITIEGTRSDGSKIVRVRFLNPPPINHLVRAQAYYSRDEKKAAKLNYKRKNR